MRTAQHKRGLRLSIDTYCAILIMSAALYFLRPPDLSIYVFDVVWAFGLMLYPGLFLRMPGYAYVALSIFAATVFLSMFYCLVAGRPNDVFQAVIILMRFSQIAICGNFFYNVVRTFAVRPQMLLVPALIGLLTPIAGGLLLYFVSPDAAIVFNRYSGYVDNPNGMALYIVVVAPVFFALLRMRIISRYFSYIIFVLFIAMSIYSLILTGSNSGAILFAVVVAATFLNSFTALVLGVIAAVLMFALGQVFEHSIVIWAQGLASSDFAGFRRSGELILNVFFGFDLTSLGSLSYRMQTQEFIFDTQFSDVMAIILGLGPGQSKFLMQQVDGNSVTIHNFYLRMFAEFGIVGSLAFAGMIVAFFRRFSWQYRSFLVVSGLLLASLGTPALYLPYYWIPPLATIAAISLLSRRRVLAGRQGLLGTVQVQARSGVIA